MYRTEAIAAAARTASSRPKRPAIPPATRQHVTQDVAQAYADYQINEEQLALLAQVEAIFQNRLLLEAKTLTPTQFKARLAKRPQVQSANFQ